MTGVFFLPALYNRSSFQFSNFLFEWLLVFLNLVNLIGVQGNYCKNLCPRLKKTKEEGNSKYKTTLPDDEILLY